MPLIDRPPSADYYKSFRNPGGVSRFPPGGRSPLAPGRLVPYQPPTTPIYPRPIGGSPPSKPPIPRLPGGVGRGVGGAFRVPPGAGAAARGGAAFVGRRIPYVALGFLAFDAFLIACAAGWMPGNICPRPDRPAPGGGSSYQNFQGGQCFTVYEVGAEGFVDLGQGAQSNGVGILRVNGPVYGVREERGQSSPSNYYWRMIVIHNKNGVPGETVHNSASGGSASILNSYGALRFVRRFDNQPDNCGNPPIADMPRLPPQEITNTSHHINNININIFILQTRPPQPRPVNPPRNISPPNPFPDVIVRENISPNEPGAPEYQVEYLFNPQPGLPLQNPDDFFNNFPPSPFPSPNLPNPIPRLNPVPQPSPPQTQFPQIPPPISLEFPPDSTESDIYQYRQNREILDKLYRANAEILEIQDTLARQNLVLENLQRLLDFEVEGAQLITRCDGIDYLYSYKGKALTVINKQLDHIKQIEQIVINEVCEIEEASVVAAPDWWQVRLRGDVPQIALIFRVSANRTYHKLTIPHPKNTNKLLIPPIPTYKKGNWQGELVLVDNSKFLCNCATKSEALRLTAIAATLIDPVFLGDPVRAYYAERKGHEVKQGDMHATSAMYFPFGQQQTRPEWRVSFTKDGR